MLNGRYCAFDVETPNRHSDRICSLGIALIEQGRVTYSREYLVNPEVPFDSYNTKIHGIDAEAVKNAPAFPEIWSEVEPFFYELPLVAHNARYDLSVLFKTLDAYGIETDDFQYLCTWELSKEILPEHPCHTLDALCALYDIPLDHHKAGSDAVACAELLLHLMDEGAEQNEEAYVQIASKHKEKKPQKSHVRHTKESLAARELNDLLLEVTNDGVLTEGEAKRVSVWLSEHTELAGVYPFDMAFVSLRVALADGVLAPQELTELCRLFSELSDPVGHTNAPSGTISLEGKKICLTGEFDRGSRDELEQQFTALGAVCKKSVLKSLDYLIVGGQGSSAWSNGNYGTKVKKALEWQEKGMPIRIIREEDFFKALKGIE